MRVKGCPALLAAAQELDKGTKEFWKLKEQVGDLVREDLEPLVAHNLTPDNVRAAKQEWKVCIAAEGLVGVFPVGGSWGSPPAIDIRCKPGLHDLRLNYLLRTVLMKGVDTAHFGLWVPLSAPEARRRKRKAGQEDSARSTAPRREPERKSRGRDRRS